MKKLTAALFALTALVCGVIVGFGIASVPNKRFEKPYSQSDPNASSASYTALTVNINTANRNELMKLDGIGETKADAIIRYREEHGFFVSVEEIKNVNGIGDAVFESIKDHICVG